MTWWDTNVIFLKAVEVTLTSCVMIKLQPASWLYLFCTRVTLNCHVYLLSVIWQPDVICSADTNTFLCHFVNIMCSELSIAVLTVFLTFHFGCLNHQMLRLVCVTRTVGCCIVFHLHAFWMMLLSLYTVSAALLRHADFHTRDKLITFLWICVF